jgi:hypothetical protein
MKPMAYSGLNWTTSVDSCNRSNEELLFLGQHVGSCQVRAWHGLRDAAETAQAFFAGRTVTCLVSFVFFLGLITLAL